MADGSLDHMQISGILPMAWNPLGDVFRHETPQTLRISALLEKLEKKYGITGDLILLAWIFQHPAGVIPVCGTASPERARKLTDAVKIKLEPEDWFALWVESRGSKVP
jgi:predicted oxidoreductase